MYVPRHKYDLVEWLSNHYMRGKAHFNRMNKKQLLAIYFSTRRNDK